LNLHRFLAGTLALVLITGFGAPAFAEPISVGGQISGIPEDVSTPSVDEFDIIFNGGSSNFDTQWAFNGFPIPSGVSQAVADDFVLNEDSFVTDVHFDIFIDVFPDPPVSYNVIFYDDDQGLPGNVIAERSAVGIHNMDLGQASFRVWFDLDVPVSLDGGVTYWLEINHPTLMAGWWTTDTQFGNSGAFRTTGPCCMDWTPFSDFGPPESSAINFVLTGHSTVVGGELLSIDSTSLILAGAQSFSWMIPVILSGIGIGLFVVSRNSLKLT